MKIFKFIGDIELEDGDSIKIWNKSKTKYIVVANDYADNIFIDEKSVNDVGEK